MRRTTSALLAFLLSIISLQSPVTAWQGAPDAARPQASQDKDKKDEEKKDEKKDEAKQDEAKRIRFAVVGDTGTGDKYQIAVARQMAAEHTRNPFEFVLMLGDNIYGGKFSKIGAVFDMPYAELLK